MFVHVKRLIVFVLHKTTAGRNVYTGIDACTCANATGNYATKLVESKLQSSEKKRLQQHKRYSQNFA